MGRTVVDLPTRVVHEFLSINESANHFDRYVAVSIIVYSCMQCWSVCVCVCVWGGGGGVGLGGCGF